MSVLSSSHEELTSLLANAKKVAGGSTIEDAGIDPGWMTAYAKIARRCRDDKDFWLSRYPYEQGPSVSAFNGGFFAHREWPLRRHMERHNSLRPVYEYECNYINSAGYWMSFHESAISLRQQALADKEDDDALKFDVWALMSIRYGLRVVGLRSEFYKLAAKDPTYAKLVMPTLESRADMPASDDLVEPLEKLESHMATQLMKAVATLSASNATKRAGGKSATKDQ